LKRIYRINEKDIKAKYREKKLNTETMYFNIYTLIFKILKINLKGFGLKNISV